MKPLLHPTKQGRSLATQERILVATEKLLRKEPFSSISIRRIIEEAKTSIGSFYARFRDKDALLAVLNAESERRLEKRLTVLEKRVFKAETLWETAATIADHFVNIYGENPNLSRAVFEYATRSPKAPELEALAKRRRTQYAFLFDALLRFEDEITHTDPSHAVDLGLYFLTVACRNRLIYSHLPQSRTMRLSKKDLKTELARMFVGYLKLEA